eukprot:g19151.t1
MGNTSQGGTWRAEYASGETRVRLWRSDDAPCPGPAGALLTRLLALWEALDRSLAWLETPPQPNSHRDFVAVYQRRCGAPQEEGEAEKEGEGTSPALPGHRPETGDGA